ncbi:MAG: GNAT family N-acetyltransferase [Elusimicrobia bacterium]|nr:GNAT family N-acetyltransferase [Elusimicrobiota bacterium]
MLEHADAAARAALGPQRAAEWAGAVGTAAFLERNDRLYRHPFGRARVETWLWRVGGEVVSSMDALQVRLLVKGGTSVGVPGFLIASVVTPPEHRGRGCASAMLEAYFAARPGASGVLYSDIAPAFYRRFGFLESPMKALSAAVEPSAARLRPVPVAEGLAVIAKARLEALAAAPGPALALAPDPEFVDWQLERYRHFADAAGRSFPKTCFWRDGADWVFAVPHWLLGRVDVLWRSGPRLDVLHAAAGSLGLPKMVYWGQGEGKAECPMARLSGSPAAFLDPQLCDWW